MLFSAFVCLCFLLLFIYFFFAVVFAAVADVVVVVVFRSLSTARTIRRSVTQQIAWQIIIMTLEITSKDRQWTFLTVLSIKTFVTSLFSLSDFFLAQAQIASIKRRTDLAFIPIFQLYREANETKQIITQLNKKPAELCLSC